MNLPHRRRSRPRGQARLAIAGDFPGDEPVTDALNALPPWDGTTLPPAPSAVIFEDVSGAGPHPAAFPAPGGDPRDTGPQQRMPRLARVRQRPRPDRPYDAALFTWSGLLDQFIMLCGTCPPQRRNRYADPVAGHMPHGFEALRVSAYQAGWRLDRFARWACPACQRTPAYWAPYSLIHWDPGAAGAYGTSGEREYRAAAEHDLILAVRAAAGRYRHAGGAR